MPTSYVFRKLEGVSVSAGVDIPEGWYQPTGTHFQRLLIEAQFVAGGTLSARVADGATVSTVVLGTFEAGVKRSVGIFVDTDVDIVRLRYSATTTLTFANLIAVQGADAEIAAAQESAPAAASGATSDVNLIEIGGTAVAAGAGANSAGVQRVTLATDDSVPVRIGATNEAAPATDTAASGLNGRLQRIAQRITSFFDAVAAFVGANAGSVVGKTGVISLVLDSASGTLRYLAGDVAGSVRTTMPVPVFVVDAEQIDLETLGAATTAADLQAYTVVELLLEPVAGGAFSDGVVNLQKSADSVTWFSILPFTINNANDQANSNPVDVGAYRYWRIAVTSAETGGGPALLDCSIMAR